MYRGKYIQCVSIKTVCFVLAIINAIANSLILICCFVIGVMLRNGSMKIGRTRFKRCYGYDPRADYEYDIPMVPVVSVGILLLFMMFSFLTLLFSVLLCYGINKRRPGAVMAYFVYGCVMNVLVATASIAQLTTDKDMVMGLWGVYGGITCVIHSLFLVLVFKTHARLKQEANFTDHVRLKEVDTKNVI